MYVFNIYIYIYICVYTYIYSYIYRYIYKYIYIYLYIYKLIYLYMYISAYRQIQIDRQIDISCRCLLLDFDLIVFVVFWFVCLVFICYCTIHLFALFSWDSTIRKLLQAKVLLGLDAGQRYGTFYIHRITNSFFVQRRIHNGFVVYTVHQPFRTCLLSSARSLQGAAT